MAFGEEMCFEACTFGTRVFLELRVWVWVWVWVWRVRKRERERNEGGEVVYMSVFTREGFVVSFRVP